ncbi:hypothetical protein LB553_19400 [Mesorhizobium sp. CA8]|nr:hypothetical protein [Mesorhizobium sp. CA8]
MAIQERNRDSKPLAVAGRACFNVTPPPLRAKTVSRKRRRRRCLLTAPKTQLLSLSVKFVSWEQFQEKCRTVFRPELRQEKSRNQKGGGPQ